ncbi:hypothetical protein U3A55_11905 [Salarchaeum sp. III]|uniref:hypothetical protein n=1 Tax=Salarchaeum sp. III TaxID=3107927 RepID=UPI002ED87120
MELDSDFEDDLREALLDDVEARFREEYGPQLKQYAQERWEAYAAENDYDIDHIWEDATLTVEREGDGVRVRIEWPELTALFEHGVEPHQIRGDLHFYWDAKDQWIQTDEVNWGSETGGIPESRAIRDALREFEAVMSS